MLKCHDITLGVLSLDTDQIRYQSQFDCAHFEEFYASKCNWHHFFGEKYPFCPLSGKGELVSWASWSHGKQFFSFGSRSLFRVNVKLVCVCPHANLWLLRNLQTKPRSRWIGVQIYQPNIDQTSFTQNRYTNTSGGLGFQEVQIYVT